MSADTQPKRNSAEILQRIEATLTGQATFAAQQAAATNAPFAQGDFTAKNAIIALEVHGGV